MSLTRQIMINGVPHIYMFSYGSNHFKQVCDRLNLNVTSRDTKWKYTRACQLNNYVRAFFTHSKKWDSAVATIVPSKGNRVYGLAIPMTETELNKMSQFEGSDYRIININPIDNKKLLLNYRCVAYAHKNSALTQHKHTVSASYLLSIVTLMRDYRRKLNRNIYSPSYSIDIRHVTTGNTLPQTNFPTFKTTLVKSGSNQNMIGSGQIGYNYRDLFQNSFHRQVGGLIPPPPPNPPNIDYTGGYNGKQKLRKFQRWEWNPKTNQYDKVKISGAGVIILEYYHNGKPKGKEDRQEWAVVLFEQNRKGKIAYEELGGTCEQKHQKISNTALEETREESCNYIQFKDTGTIGKMVNQRDVFVQFNEYRCYFVALPAKSLSAKEYHKNKTLLDKAWNKYKHLNENDIRRPPRAFIETTDMKRFYLSDLQKHGLLDYKNNPTQFPDTNGKFHSFFGRTRGALRRGLDTGVIKNVFQNGVKKVSSLKSENVNPPHYLAGTNHITIS